MLNLVQLQERLKDVPMQALMSYANGANPQVPPYLALGELNRRKQIQESAASEQAKQQAGAPTVKDQIEQQAGLMALQGNRMRQAAQQQQGMQAKMPMAAPNTMTSEPAQMAMGGAVDDVMRRDFQRGGQAQLNPEMLKKLMMMKAMKQRQRPRAGIAGLPVDTFKRQDFQRGGIVGYAGDAGSYVDPVGAAPYETDDQETRRARELLRRKYAGMASPLGMFKPVAPGQEKEYQEARGDVQNLLKVLDRYNKEDLGSIEKALADRMGKFERKQWYDTRAAKPTEPAFSANEPDVEPRMPPRAPTTVPKTATPTAPKAEPAKAGIGSFWEQELKKRYEAPDADITAGLAALQRPKSDRSIKESQRQLKEMEEGDTFAERLLALDAGRFGSGKLGKSMAKYEQDRTTRANELKMGIAKAEDLEAQADYADKLGKFKLAEELRAKASEIKLNILKAGSEADYRSKSVEAQRDAARKPSQFAEVLNALKSSDPATVAAAEKFLGASKTGALTDALLLKEWNDMSMIDKAKLKRDGINTIEQYMAARRGQTGAGAGNMGSDPLGLRGGR